jgi:hypothetical protein
VGERGVQALQRLAEASMPHPGDNPRLPAGGLQAFSGLFVMQGDEGGVLVEPVGVEIDEGGCGGGVEPGAALGQERPVGNLLRQGMPEAVFHDAHSRSLLEELGGTQRTQHVGEVLRRLGGHGGEDRLGERPSDHRGHLERRLLPLGKPVDTGGRRRLHGGRHPHVAQRAREPGGAGCTVEGPILHQGAHQLLDEERIAAGALDDVGQQGGEGRVGPEEIAQELADRAGPQGGDRKLAVIRLTHPVRRELRPEVGQHQRPSPGVQVDQVAQEGGALWVEPVEVLDQQEQRFLLAATTADPV